MNVSAARASLRLSPLSLSLPCRCKGSSSDNWIKRQINDPYVDKAKQHNYRCRSAFKLIEINEKANFLHPGKVVVDIGAAPGSWTQVAVHKVNANGQEPNKPRGAVFSLDLRFLYPIEGATILSNCDFQVEESRNKLKAAMNETKADAVISDMAPNSSGVKSMDHENIISMCYEVFRFASQVSQKNACLLVKVWSGAEVSVLELDLSRFYKSVKIVKPPSSRSDSAELFLFAKGFKGLA